MISFSGGRAVVGAILGLLMIYIIKYNPRYTGDYLVLMIVIGLLLMILEKHNYNGKS